MTPTAEGTHPRVAEAVSLARPLPAQSSTSRHMYMHTHARVHVHVHMRMGGACPRVRPDPGWPYRHSRARNARGSQCICPCCTRAPARECQGVRPAALRVSRSAPSRGPVSRCVPRARQWVQTPNTNGEDLLTACRRYTKHGTLRSWGYLTPNPPVINLHDTAGVSGRAHTHRPAH